ncbi:MAG: hypothetical protein IPM14_04325 [bacterium]|nr:hypothetical protein [bacterium]
MKNKTILVLIILIGLGSNIFGQEKFRKMAYLVQSVGSQIYTQNGVTTDVPAELLAYNIANNYTGEDSCTIYNPTDDYPPGGNRLWE